VHLEPLADWCEADYVEKRVERIDAKNNRLHFEGGGDIAYDVLGINVGSKTRGASQVEGALQHSLTTRPINDLLGKIERKEEYLVKNNITPTIAVCGSGAAGIELAFAFKNRWTRNFKKDIKTMLLCNQEDIMI
jgi:NADH dehydrogenase FAD-containing subunit